MLDVRVETEWASGKQLRLCALEIHEDPHCESVSLTSDGAVDGVPVTTRVSLLARGNECPHLVIQMAMDWKGREPRDAGVRLPFLSALASTGCVRVANRLSGAPDGPDEMSWVQADPPPLVLLDGSQALGLELPVEFPGRNNANGELAHLRQVRDVQAHDIRVLPTRTLTDVLDIRLHGSAQGWPGVFSSWKTELRSRYDLRRYSLPGARWARSSFLQHFTFAYGSEAYDYEAGELRIDRVLDEGREMGGYDAVIFWHQYPRLGLDARTQWDLYDELPDGREEIRRIAALCHSRGARFLLPFKPWDVRSDQSLKDEAARIHELVASCDVDGFFLDTMASIPDSFAELQRLRFPDLLFAAELTPTEPRQIEQIVCSWDQRPHGEEGVGANLFRFLFHEHALNVVSRWSVGSRKDDLIRRAIFNGTGMVIWQDVFGSWLPFSALQRSLIRSWKAVLSAHTGLFFGDRSVPLYPTSDLSIIANCFQSAASRDRIVTIYNRGDTRYLGNATRMEGVGPSGARLLLASDSSAEATLDGSGSLWVALGPREVMAVLIRTGS